jgi:hypothetical protein
VAALVIAGGVVAVASPAAATGRCPTVTWGSLAKQAGGLATSQVPIQGARAGINECFDRLVIDLGGQPVPNWSVGYGAITSTAGNDIVLAGGASLQITVRSPAYDGSGHSTIVEPLPDVTGFPVFREVRFVESFEAVTVYGLGVRARLPFRVFTLSGPGGGSRLVIDVYQHW